MVAEQRFDDLYKEVINLRVELATLSRDDGVGIPISNCIDKIEEITKKNEEVVIEVKGAFATVDQKNQRHRTSIPNCAPTRCRSSSQ